MELDTDTKSPVLMAAVGVEAESILPVLEKPLEENNDSQTKTKITIHSIREHGSNDGKIPFYAVPIQRQRWGYDHVHPHIDWGDLFFDLFFVAACYRLGNLLKSDMVTGAGFRGIAYYVGLFGPLLQVWQHKTFYDARFTLVDHSHRIHEVVRLFFLAFAILHVENIARLSDEDSPVSLYFAIGILGESFLSILKYVEVYFVGTPRENGIKTSAFNTIVYQGGAVSFVSSLTAVIVSALFYAEGKSEKDGDNHRFLASIAGGSPAWVRGDIPVMILLTGYVITLMIFPIRTYLTSGVTKEEYEKNNIPINIDFVAHRQGEWVLLMLGESVLSLLIVQVKETVQYYIIFFFGIGTVILVQHFHFQSQPSHASSHAMRRSRVSGVSYNLAFQIYSMALVALGASYKIMLYDVNEGDSDDNNDYDRSLAGSSEEDKQRAAHLFCSSLFIVLICHDFMTLMHKGIGYNISRCTSGNCTLSKKRKKSAKIIILCKTALHVFTVTLSQWTVDPEILTIAGSLIVMSKIIISNIAWYAVRYSPAPVSISNGVPTSQT